MYLTVDNIDPKREIQQVGDDEQYDSRRQAGIPECQKRERQAQVAAVIEHHWRHKGPEVVFEQDGDRPGDESGAKENSCCRDRQSRITAKIEILAGHHGKCQRGQKHIDADGVDGRKIGSVAQAIEVAEAGDCNHRNHDIKNSDQHRQEAIGLVQSIPCSIAKALATR